MPAEVHKPFLESTVLGHITSHYARFEHTVSSLSLFGGFAFDAFTLKRVDTFWENFWVLAHLVLVAGCIVLINRSENRRSETKPSEIARSEESGKSGKKIERLHFWTINVLQFLFGGLMSTYLVFYFRSGSLRASWPFFLLLAAAFIANEKLKQRLARLNFQIGFFFLSLFFFAIYVVPVIVHSVGRLVFLLSGGISLGLVWLFLRLLESGGGEKFAAQKGKLKVSIAALFLAVNALYFLNLIPPLPLSLQDASVDHSIVRAAPGKYLLETEEQGRLRFVRFAVRIHSVPGEPLYVYSAVFSPTLLNTQIVHVWQTYDGRHGWVTTDRIVLAVRGGRDGGWRTYSEKAGVGPGAWRVSVETPNGAVLGRVRFDVLAPSAAPLQLKTEMKE